MLANGLKRVQTFTSAYGESCFETICHLTNHEYDVPRLRCIMAQTFCNAVMQNDFLSTRCIEKYVKIEIQKNVSRVANWQGYIVHLALPYEKGNIEGSLFVFNWIAYIWNIEIRIWSAETTTILATFHLVEKASKIFNVIRYQTDIGNFYFEPLSPIKRNIENKNMSL